MNIIPTTNITSTSQQPELYFSPKVGKRTTNTDTFAETPSIGPNKKARIRSSMASSGRWSFGESTVHSQRDDPPILPCCSSYDVISKSPNSKLLYNSPPMLNVATFRTDNDSLTSTISTINTSTNMNTNANHIDWVELQIEFLRTLKKLSKSMQRTDQSRIFFMRALYKKHHSYLPEDDDDDDGLRYFTSSEWYQTQQYRQHFAKIVHHDCLYRTVF